MERKTFIHLSAFAAAAVSLPLLHSCTSRGGNDVMAKPGFLSGLFDEETTVNTGKAYLQKRPLENNEEKLIALLSENSAIAGSANEKLIHNYLDQKIKRDFETGNMVLVNGWVLATTEARQCALFYLVNGQ